MSVSVTILKLFVMSVVLAAHFTLILPNITSILGRPAQFYDYIWLNLIALGVGMLITTVIIRAIGAMGEGDD